jgi:hypothetical protein
MDDIDAVVSLKYSLPISRRHLGGSSSSFQFFALSIGLIER